MQILMKSLGVILALGLVACQLTPTKVKETRTYETQKLVEKASKKLEITEQTRVIDTRSGFEYSIGHVPGSININWEHYSRKGGVSPGLLPEDLGAVARRLALKGLHPSVPVIVVGDGRGGKGEEGRIAWMLVYLGFSDVQVANIKVFNGLLTNVLGEDPKNAKVWTPQVRESLLTTKKEFVQSLRQRSDSYPLRVLDVRSKEEYFAKEGWNQPYNTPDLNALHIDWKEFFTQDGRPDLSMLKKLQAIQVGVNDPIVVLSNQGVRSAAVTWALLAMGFRNVSNYVGGYSDLKVR